MNIRWICAALLVVGKAGAWPAGSDRWRETYETGLGLYRDGQYERARPILLQALAEVDQGTSNYFGRAATLHVLGVTEKSLRMYEDARGHLEAAARSWPEDGNSQRQRAITLESLAYLAWETGDFEGAEQRFLAAIAAKQQLYGGESPEEAAVESNLAELYLCRDELPRARTVLERVLRIQQVSLAAADPDLLATRGRLAGTLMLQGELERARAVAAAAETAARDVAIYPDILAILGEVYRREGNRVEGVAALASSLGAGEERGARPSDGRTGAGLH